MMMKRNFIKSICEFHLINYKEFCKLTQIPYRTMQNWLYNEREMPKYIEGLIISRFQIIYGWFVHDVFMDWYYTSDVEMAIKYKGFTQETLEIIERKNRQNMSENE